MKAYKYKAYRFEYQSKTDPESWGWDVVEAVTYARAKKWIFDNYGEDYEINYIAELKYERSEEEPL